MPVDAVPGRVAEHLVRRGEQVVLLVRDVGGEPVEGGGQVGPGLGAVAGPCERGSDGGIYRGVLGLQGVAGEPFGDQLRVDATLLERVVGAQARRQLLQRGASGDVVVGRQRGADLVGEAAESFAGVLDGQAPAVICGTIDKAARQAFEDARASGEDAIVLLSPACASFDQFPDFEVRGDLFRQVVRDLALAKEQA